MIKVLHITNNLQVGGAETDLILKSLYLAKQKKIKLSILPLYGNYEILKKFPELKKYAAIERPLIGRLSDYFFLPLKIKKIISSYQPELIHSHLFKSNLLSRLFVRKVPIICSYQNLTDLTYWFELFLERALQYRTFMIIAASQAIKNSYTAAGIDKNRIEVIYNTFVADVNKYSKKRSDKFVIGTVARLHRIKGIEYAVRAIDILVNKYELKNIEYRIAGDGAERPNIQKLINKLKLQNHVKLLGTVSDPAEEYKKMDLFLLPSLSEGLGISILEAFAYQVPVLASRVGGIPEILSKNNLFPPADPKILAVTILKYRGEPAKYRSEYVKVLNKFKLELLAEKQYKIYQKAVGHE